MLCPIDNKPAVCSRNPAVKNQNHVISLLMFHAMLFVAVVTRNRIPENTPCFQEIFKLHSAGDKQFIAIMFVTY